ncbi:ATP-binding protein [Haloarcula sebkhae]|uniref:ATP-binding protein n=2 Tax=Haloarcula sebkhae TaxID=932660 RepID=A0ACC6VHC0_9EURY|nr:ATP-binding protein [Haloarcula sebkhae]GGK56082.1 hypothetical protein GCM10009067_05730 [Haloarcula sebkhae]
MSTDSDSTQQSLISPRLFIKSVRDLGLDTIDAVNEFIDNSFDANAANIWITVENNDRGGLRLVVEDDGEGIPENEIIEALKFGGQIDRDRRTTGKFGFGLPSSAFCQAEHTEIYSTTAEEDQFYKSQLKVEQLLGMDEEDIHIPSPEPVDELPEEVSNNLDEDSTQGTIIHIPNLRRPDRKTASALSSFLKENVSQTQREVIQEGHKIHMNGEEVPIHDPLMWIDESYEVQELDKSKRETEFTIEYPDWGEEDEVPKVTVEIFLLPMREIIRREAQDEFNINQSNQGFYIIRENREIGESLTLSLFTRHNNLNYFRGRIHFPEELDDLFGVQTNKSRFSLDSELRNDIKDHVGKTTASLRNTISQKREMLKNEFSSAEESFSRAERVANELVDFLPRSDYNSDSNEIKNQETDIKNLLEGLEEDDELSPQQKESLRETYELMLEKDYYFEVTEANPASGNFYEVEWSGKEIEVQVNTQHPFYEELYRPLTADSGKEIDRSDIKLLVDLLLITLAKREDAVYGNEQLRDFYERERRKWTTILYDLYENADDHIGG